MANYFQLESQFWITKMCHVIKIERDLKKQWLTFLKDTFSIN